MEEGRKEEKKEGKKLEMMSLKRAEVQKQEIRNFLFVQYTLLVRLSK